ncbi:MAG: pyridoxamine 5'-phosphate oxidase [Proteobacteria bacterium]|jgi:pyridoxamine 5'-phosphate oxidase|nr:pyridoxamine 5'-phosphate oxidase [Pseudomonadota bacterium]
MSFDLNQNPFDHFKALFAEAEIKVPKDPNAMSLATVGPDGAPSLRTVLFKGLTDNGFIFYTNYESQKGTEIEAHPRVSLLFFWSVMDLQVRIQGTVTKLSAEKSDEYFKSRPRLSQIGAWASAQSQKIFSIQQLEEQVKSFEAKFQGLPIPRPPHWGGFEVIPWQIEFWFGKQGRLHERYVYERSLSDARHGIAQWEAYMKSP